MPPLVGRIVSGAVAIALVLLVTGQCRRPRWLLGRLFLWNMNVRHSGVTDWGLGHVKVEKNFTILDIGCGGGRTIQKLATIASEGKVYGVDYSPASVASARRTNADFIAQGRVEIQQASVVRLPFPDGMFDVVTAIETHYYWPNLVEDLREVMRVIKPGGTLLLIAEAYRGSRFDALMNPAMKLLRATYMSVDEHRDLFSTAGYTDVDVSEERSKGWVCAVGKRPVGVPQ